MKTKSISAILAIMLTMMLLTVPATAQEEISAMNIYEGDVLLTGKSYSVEFEQPLPTNPVVVVGIVAKGEPLSSGNWQITNNDCEPWTFTFFVRDDIIPGEYNIEIVVFSRSSSCYFLSSYGRATIENVTIVVIDTMEDD